MIKIKVNYPKLPTRILTLEITFENEIYYFGIAEYDYQAQFLKKHEEQIENLILKYHGTKDFATLNNPYIIYFVDGNIA